MKYRTKVLFLLMSTVVVTTGLSVGILSWYFERVLRDQIGSQVLTVAATTAAFLDEWRGMPTVTSLERP